MSTEANFEGTLYAADLSRQAIRKDYKRQMHDNTTSNLPNGIHFPAIHITANDIFLRNGLSWLYNGFLLVDDNLCMAVDPGVDFLYRLQKSNINPSAINAVYISHAHLDHAGGANVLLDWLIRAQLEVQVIVPQSVIDTKAISDFHLGLHYPAGWQPLQQVIVAQPGKPVTLPGGHTLQPIGLEHGIECLGFMYEGAGLQSVGYISDTGYALKVEYAGGEVDITAKQVPEGKFVQHTTVHNHIRQAYKDARTLIANIDSFAHTKNSKTHLCIFDLLDILEGAKAERVILAHINPMGEVEYSEWGKLLAEYVERRTGLLCQALKVDGLHTA